MGGYSGAHTVWYLEILVPSPNAVVFDVLWPLRVTHYRDPWRYPIPWWYYKGHSNVPVSSIYVKMVCLTVISMLMMGSFHTKSGDEESQSQVVDNLPRYNS